MPDLALARAALSAVVPRRPAGSYPVALEERDVRVDRARLDAYAQVCGFRVNGAASLVTVPLTYPHVLAFGLTMRLMTRRDFPFPLPGLVHVRDVVTRYRPLGVDEAFGVTVRHDGPVPHPKGAAVDVVTDVSGETGMVVWTERSTYLRRERTSGTARGSGAGGSGAGGSGAGAEAGSTELAGMSRWRVPADTGRRYARVSGDYNPIHLSGLTARAFGFRGAIAHGMWTMTRSVAELEDRLPHACTVAVDFVAPLPLPSEVAFSASNDASTFEVRPGGHPAAKPHLTGTCAELSGG